MKPSHTLQENMEEKTMRKRFLSLLLVLACVLTLAVVPVIAAEPDRAALCPHDGALGPSDGADRTDRTDGTQPGAHTDWPVVSGGDGLCPRSRHFGR